MATSTDTGVRIVLAGATGALGHRVAAALAQRGADVVALMRPDDPAHKQARVARLGVAPHPVDFADPAALGRACRGAQAVVSTLNGLEPVMIGLQGRMLDAAVAAGVPRFVPSDFALDFTGTQAGRNRNLDLRRRFMRTVDAAPIRATSILNGGFLELLAGDAPLAVDRIARVIHFGDPHQPLDFTAMDDVAGYTAAAALDPEAPRILRIAGDSVSPADLARTLSDLTGRRWRTLRLGGIGALSALIAVIRTLSPKTDAPFPAWQGMQYMRDQMSGQGKLHPLDNDRYGSRDWRQARAVLAEVRGIDPGDR